MVKLQSCERKMHLISSFVSGHP